MTEVKKVPKLRFREFSDEWQEIKFKEISLSFYQGINTAADRIEYSQKGYPILQAKHITKQYLDFRDTRYLSKEYFEEYKSKYRPEADDILISNIGTLGKIVLVDSAEDFLIAWNIFKVTLDKKKVAPVFILALLNRVAETGYFDKVKTGNATKFVNKTDVMAIKLQLPSIQEQNRIAEFLTAVDEKIEELQKRKDLLEKYKKGVMQKIFSQQVCFKDESGTDYPDWEEKLLGEIGEIITGKTPSTSNKTLWNGDVMFVTPTDIVDGNKYQNTSERSVKATKELLPKKTIMYTCIASIGKMSLSTKPAITNQQINSLIPTDNFNNEFIYYVLLWLTPKIKAASSDAAFPIINKTEFTKIKIPVACKSEQQHIAEFLSLLDDKIKLEESRLEQAKQYKKSLLQQMFV